MALFGGTKINTIGTPLEVGQKLPDFKLVDKDLTPKTLADFDGKIKVFTIVPSVDTGVCDAQTRKFNEMYRNNSEVATITVSMDLPFALSRFCGNAGIENAITLSDYQTAQFGKDFGVLFEGVRLLQRAVVIADKTNTITYVEYMEESGNAVNFDAAAQAVNNLL